MATDKKKATPARKKAPAKRTAARKAPQKKAPAKKSATGKAAAPKAAGSPSVSRVHAALAKRQQAVASPLGYETQPEVFVSSLETILLSYAHEDNLSIDLAVELSSTSKRSLQRKLKEMGTSYKEVLGRARFRAASEMLQNQTMAVADIALHLGYSHGTHFARAFRRIAGVNPSVYRRQFIH
jgi:AraC-like DNA-binding protein